jgi:Flp pilus assembly protein TadD
LPQSKIELKEETEDALALGNSARDAKPPRYEDAERAYKLAAKLSPKDPRPHIGLGNMYYDQKRYAEAAEHYKEALSLQQQQRKEEAIVGAIVGAIIGIGRGMTEDANLHAYTGYSLIRQKKWDEAEVELKKATIVSNAQFYALLGYAQFEQQKYDKAVFSYAEAVMIEPQNETYKGLLEEARRKQNAPSSK